MTGYYYVKHESSGWIFSACTYKPIHGNNYEWSIVGQLRCYYFAQTTIYHLAPRARRSWQEIDMGFAVAFTSTLVLRSKLLSRDCVRGIQLVKVCRNWLRTRSYHDRNNNPIKKNGIAFVRNLTDDCARRWFKNRVLFRELERAFLTFTFTHPISFRRLQFLNFEISQIALRKSTMFPSYESQYIRSTIFQYLLSSTHVIARMLQSYIYKLQ